MRIGGARQVQIAETRRYRLGYEHQDHKGYEQFHAFILNH